MQHGKKFACGSICTLGELPDPTMAVSTLFLNNFSYLHVRVYDGVLWCTVCWFVLGGVLWGMWLWWVVCGCKCALSIQTFCGLYVSAVVLWWCLVAYSMSGGLVLWRVLWGMWLLWDLWGCKVSTVNLDILWCRFLLYSWLELVQLAREFQLKTFDACMHVHVYIWNI